MSRPALPDELTADPDADGPTPHPFASVVVSHDDGPDECTVYPVDVTEDELLTRWITAEEGSYVSVHRMR